MDMIEINSSGNEYDNIWLDENGTGHLELEEVIASNKIYNVIKQLCIFFFVLVGAGTFSFVLIAINVYNEVNKEHKATIGYGSDIEVYGEEDNAEEDTEDEVNFLKKYLDEYRALEERVICDEELSSFKNLYLEEKTPRGIILMCYDKNTGAFEYFSTSKDIPYSYLEVVARSYVLKYLCKELLIDTSVELEKAQKLKKQLEDKTKKKDSILDTVDLASDEEIEEMDKRRRKDEDKEEDKNEEGRISTRIRKRRTI